MDTDSRHPAVYLLASQRLGTLYIGVTSDLVQRVWQHRQGLADGFTARHGVKRLVWYEQHETMPAAIAREKPIPVYFIGVGEKLEDLETFNAREFAQALLA